MSFQSSKVLTNSLHSPALAPSARLTERALRKALGILECGELIVEMPGGGRVVFRGAAPGPQAYLVVHRWRFLARLASDWDIGFAESYMSGEWSSPDLIALLTLACRNQSVADRLGFFRIPRLWLKLRHALNRNTRRGSRRNIAAHYDLGNEFYKHWLDASMTYSAGLFSNRVQSLEAAQEAKIDQVIELLEPQDGARIFEIGCGWGGLAEHLLKKTSCTLAGITLSTEQLEYSRQRLADFIAAGRCDLRLQDYRDVHGLFDRIVSIEMLEAVGEAYWSQYFKKLRGSLRPGGIAVLQVITIAEDRFESYRRRPDFIQKYIFPGGMLPTKQIIEREASQVGLKVVARQFFGDSYGRTLEHWHARFQDAWPTIKALGFDERFRRMWRYYLAYCQVGFETRALDVGFFKIVRPEN
jgi:cyclopropane-fatty-acyl-phospholipid synthase